MAAGTGLNFPARETSLTDGAKPTKLNVSLNLFTEKLIRLRCHSAGPQSQASIGRLFTQLQPPCQPWGGKAAYRHSSRASWMPKDKVAVEGTSRTEQ